MQDEEYNGWKNRETWLTALWIGNDRGLCETAVDAAKLALERTKDASDLLLGAYVRAALHDALCDETGFRSGLIRAAFARIDWRAIGRMMRERI